MEKFIPVKVTNKEWADKLLDGEVFMRPLHEFGSWNQKKDEAVNNQFRGDINEGTAAVYRDVNKFPGIGQFPEDFRNVLLQASVIDDTDIQYFKIFSLYRMIYNPATDFFIKPDPRMAEFGDTAVIIRDYNEFIERFGKALFAKYDKVSSMIDVVNFYNFNETRQTNPLFEKIDTYKYQNELRMAFCELERDEFAVGSGADTALRTVNDLTPVKLNIGSIRDIAVSIPMEDFLDLKFPEDLCLCFPMNEENPSNYDEIVKWSREQMKNYRTILGKPMFVVG